MRRCFLVLFLLVVAVSTLGGCRIRAPLHVWEPPILASTVGKRVVLTTVAGPEELSQKVREKLLAMAPRDDGRQTHLVDYRALQNQAEIQLVSASDREPNDVAIASVARRP